MNIYDSGLSIAAWSDVICTGVFIRWEDIEETALATYADSVSENINSLTTVPDLWTYKVAPSKTNGFTSATP